MFANRNSSVLPADLQSAIDRVCDRFEADWKSGKRPELEEYLADKVPPDREPLLRELLAIDLSYRRRLTETPQIWEYLTRLPNDESTIRAAFRDDGNNASIADHADVASTTDPVDLAGYRVLGKIGEGGMGAVYRVLDATFRRTLAAKVLRRSFADTFAAAAAARFLAEARITGQLQHPGIPPVHEMGQLTDGRPYFTMKLIEGRALSALLAARPAIDTELPFLLNIFEQIAQTLAYAHAQGVIHRDLKPENVMVGAFGEVQLMDWGLAKAMVDHTDDAGLAREGTTVAITDESTRIGTTHTPTDNQDAETELGAVMGTYAYMPPEQARGQNHQVNTQSDVFGLGAILCEILTGDPPYRNSDAKPHSQQARDADLHDAMARLQSCGADEALVDLVKSCLAPVAADRPQNAGVVAQRVHDYLATVQERLELARSERAAAEAKAVEERKRRRISAALAIFLLVGAIGLAIGLFILNKQKRALATANKTERAAKLQARHAIENYVRSVQDSEVLSEPRFKELRRKLLSDAFDYYKTFLNELRLTSADQQELADALLVFGEMNYVNGTLEQAQESLQDAGKIYASLGNDFENDLKFGQLFGTLGNVQAAIGAQESAIASYDRAAEYLRHGLARDPSSDRHRLTLAIVVSNCAASMRIIGLPTATQHVQDAVDLLRTTVSSQPDEVQKRLALCLNELGRCLQDTPGRGIDAHREGLEITQELLRKSPDNFRLLKLQADLQKNLARTEANGETAIALYQESLQGYGRLLAIDASSREVWINLADTYDLLGFAQEKVQGYTAALDSFGKALQYWRKIIQENPNDLNARSGLADSLFNLGGVEFAMGDADVALKHQRESVQIRAQLALADPHRDAFQEKLGHASVDLALSVQSVNTEECVQLNDRAIQIFQTLLKKHPDRDRYHDMIGIANANAGLALLGDNRLEEAGQRYQQSLKIREAVVARNPENNDFLYSLARNYNQMVELSVRDQESGAWRQWSDKALESWMKLYGKEPENMEYNHRLGFALLIRADLLHQSSEPMEALKNLELAEPHLRMAADKEPNDVRYQQVWEACKAKRTQFQEQLDAMK